MFNIGVDVGGTFTDSVAINDEGSLFLGKAATTPTHIAVGVLASLEDLARNASVDLREMLENTHFFGHGTTVGTNALVTRRGARVGLLITAGFEDTPYIQRAIGRLAGLSEEEMRQQVSLRQPLPLVDRSNIVGVTERIDANGNVILPLDKEEAERAVQELLEQKIEAVAICLLWSFLNPAHERLLQDTVQLLAPGLPMSVSHDLAPKVRENARCNTVLIDAFIRGIVLDYLAEIRSDLSSRGFARSMASMQCFGGVTDSLYATPISSIESGPVGGVMGAKYLARLLGEENVITTDVGGTTFDVSVIVDNEEILGREYFGAAGVIDRFEVSLPRVDIQSIGAGGGTIARFDSASETMKLGPDSAGSDPGPVFYGQGGSRVTVADAWLTLGYLDEERFLGGRMEVDSAAARHAIETQLAVPLHMSVTEAALAVVTLANNHMSDAIKVYLAARGLDVSEYVLFAFGGGGPLHAAAYGQLSGVKRSYLLAEAGVFSAYGIALADTKHTQEMTFFSREPFDIDAVMTAYETLETRMEEQFLREGIASEAVNRRYFMELRYQGQFHELTVEMASASWIRQHGVDGIRESFQDTYKRVYGSAAAVAYSDVELTGLRVDGVAQSPKPAVGDQQNRGHGDSAPLETREACFSLARGYEPVPVYWHPDLHPSEVLAGPAFVQSDYLTMLVLPGQRGQVDRFRNVIIDHASPGSASS